MTNPRQPKYTKVRPFGRTQTPFDPVTGKYFHLGHEPTTVKVLVEGKIVPDDVDPETYDGQVYWCKVLDKDVEKTAERIKVHRLVYGAISLADIAADTVIFAYRVDDRWWMQSGEEEAQVPIVDFFVDNFDRDDGDSLGSLWVNGGKWAIRNQHAYEAGTGATSEVFEFKYFESIISSTGSVASNISFSSMDPPIEGAGYGSRYDARRAYTKAPKSSSVVDVLYNAVLSNGDHNIKIIGNQSIYDAEPGDPLYDWRTEILYSNFYEIVVHVPSDYLSRGTRINLAMGFINTENHPGDTASASGTWTCGHGGAYSYNSTIPPYTMSADQFAKIYIRPNEAGDWQTILTTTLSVDTYTEMPETGSVYCFQYPLGGYHAEDPFHVYEDKTIRTGGSYGLSAGYNTYYFEVRSGKVSLQVNGTTAFTDADLYTLSAGMFGFRGGYSSLTDFLDGKDDNHINQVKVWSADVPEPPDGESGHGIYINGVPTYSDKYHVSGEYNPDA